MSHKIIIVGGGIASINAIKVIRDNNAQAEIHLVTNEKFYPYNRLRLTKGLFGNISPEAILLQKKEWYETNNIKTHFGKKVVWIDEMKDKILLNDGTKMCFDKLLLATGAHNAPPPIEGINSDNVYTIRQIQDAWAVKECAVPGNKVVIIGGGIQGLETAWELSRNGMEVVVVEAHSRLMPIQLDERASQILNDMLQASKVEVFLKTKIHKILGDHEIITVLGEDGFKINCDMVIYNTGINPNISYLKETHINFNRGIIVNEKMQTNKENVYAAGDVTEFNHSIIGLWNIAIEQGKTAGYNMIGQSKVYKPVIAVTTLNAFGTSLFSMGNIKEESCNFSLVGENLNNNTYKRIFFQDNRIVGAIIIGSTKKSPLLKKAIESKISLDEFNLSQIFTDKDKMMKINNFRRTYGN